MDHERQSAWKLIFAGLLFVFSSRLPAQTPSSVMTLRSYTGAMTLQYHLFTPAGYTRTTRYPLVLTFHGIGEDGAANNAAVNSNGLVQYWVSTSFQAVHPCFVVTPHNPSGTWTDQDYWIANSTGTFHQIAISTRLSTVMGIVDSLCREFSVDTNRIYITGLSIGGFATWDLITRYPNKFAAAIPMSGAVDTSKAGLISAMPIWCVHGQSDGDVTPLSDRLMMKNLDNLDGNKGVVYPECKDNVCTIMPNTRLDSLINAGAIHLYSEQQNGGHAIWDPYYGNSRIREWLFKQSKTTSTKCIYHAPVAVSRFAASGAKRVLFTGGKKGRYGIGVSRKSRGLSQMFDIRGKELTIEYNDK